MIALVVHGGCGGGEAPAESAPPETWWERTDTGEWWFKGGKDPKHAEVVSCGELAPGFITIQTTRARMGSNYQAHLPGCNVEMSWASWWPTQLFTKQLARMNVCSDCELEVFDDGFWLAESTLHLRVVRHDGRLFASFDTRWAPDIDEVLFAYAPFRFRRPDGSRRWATLRSDCPDGSYSRGCLRMVDGITGDDPTP